MDDAPDTFVPPTARILTRESQPGGHGLLRVSVEIEFNAPLALQLRVLVTDIAESDTDALIRDAAFTRFAEEIAALAIRVEGLASASAGQPAERVWVDETMRLP